MHTFTAWLDRIAETMLILLVALLPIVFIPAPWATLPHAKIGLIALGASLGLTLYAIARFLEGAVTIPRSFILAASIALPAVYAISALWAGGGRTSFLGAGVETDTVAAIFLCVALLLLAAWSLKTRPQLMRLTQAIVVAAGLVVLFQVARLAFGSHFTFGGIFTETSASVVGSWHDLGIFLGLAGFLALALVSFMRESMSTSFAWGAWAIVVCSLFFLTIINMIDVWAALAVLSALAVLFAIVHERGAASGFSMKHLSVIAAPFLVLCIIAAAFVLYGKAIHDRLPAPIRIDKVEVRPSWEGTFAVASQRSGIQSILGSGPNTFTREWGLYKPAGVNETAFWNADFSQGVGFIPTSFVTVGVLGMLAWVALLLSLLYEGIRTVMKSQRDLRPVAAAILAAAGYAWTFAVVYRPGIALIAFAFLLTGALVGWGVHTGVISARLVMMRSVRTQGFVVSVALIVAALCAVLTGALVGRVVLSDILVNRGIAIYNSTQDIAAAQRSIGQALSVDASNERGHRAALELGLLQAAALVNSKDPNAEQLRAELTRAISQAIQHGLSAVSADSADYQNWVALARVYEQLVGVQVEGAYESATKAYEQAMKENPTNPTFNLALAQLALAQKDLNTAERELLEAIKKKPNYAEALFLASQVAAAKGDGDGALITAQAAVRAAPEEPVAWFQFGTLLYQAKRYPEARVALEQALALNANYANALYVLGLDYKELGERDLAKRAFERVLELNPGNTQVQALLKQLAEKPKAGVK